MLGFYRLGLPQKLLSLDIFRGKAVTLFSGIGDPDSFESLIKKLYMDIGLSFRFPDHYQYKDSDLEKIVSLSQQKKIDAIITTEKDASRISRLSDLAQQLPIFILRIDIKITGNERLFYDRLLSLYLN
jgi:tetraacyldisaccharide 4'-kinase